MPASEKFPHRSLWSAQRLSAREMARLFDIAAGLRGDAAAASAGAALSGRHLALVGSLDGHGAQGFIDCATALGAQVSQVDANALLSAPVQRLPELARMLGRLYDGVDCCGLPEALVDQIELYAGVPVTNGLADPAHPLRLLGDLLTMQAWSDRALRTLRLELSDATAPLTRAMAELATLLSLQVQAPTLATVDGDGAPGDQASCDFVFVPGRTAAERLRLPGGGPVSASALSMLAQAHERLGLQALLIAALG
ncbi:hypothetical protein [Caldimonas sp. KR1-144]|uniref:hypothetical protein n=1 Tax=Caldimonas sp. KR1-144 TaxID=3400911 RepID=UPI003BFF12C9